MPPSRAIVGRYCRAPAAELWISAASRPATKHSLASHLRVSAVHICHLPIRARLSVPERPICARERGPRRGTSARRGNGAHPLVARVPAVLLGFRDVGFWWADRDGWI